MDFRERYRPIGIYESEPFPGIRDLLTALRQAGKTLAIATSKPQNMAELLLERLRGEREDDAPAVNVELPTTFVERGSLVRQLP